MPSRRVESLNGAYVNAKFKHKDNHVDDYIDSPQSTGYRGIHLIYKYVSDRNDTYNDLKIEIQLRTALQHAWATAVETVGTFSGEALKSNMGPADWLRFFALMGSAIAAEEKRLPVPGSPRSAAELRRELRHHFLLVLNPVEQRVTAKGFRASERELASASTWRSSGRLQAKHPTRCLCRSSLLMRFVAPIRTTSWDTGVFIRAVESAIA